MSHLRMTDEQVKQVMSGKAVQLPLPEHGTIRVVKIGQSIQLTKLEEDVKIKTPAKAGEGEAAP